MNRTRNALEGFTAAVSTEFDMHETNFFLPGNGSNVQQAGCGAFLALSCKSTYYRGGGKKWMKHEASDPSSCSGQEIVCTREKAFSPPCECACFPPSLLPSLPFYAFYGGTVHGCAGASVVVGRLVGDSGVVGGPAAAAAAS